MRPNNARHRSNPRSTERGREDTRNRNYVWVRTDIVEAIWNNNGSLPANWKPSRKRGRNEVGGWGWCRAYVVESTGANVQSTDPSDASNQQQENPFASVKLRASPVPTRHNKPSSAGGRHRKSAHSASSQDASPGRIILVTLTVDDEEFAPPHLQQATVSLSYDATDHNLVCSANTWWNTLHHALPPSDLTTLTHLHEPSVVYCLWKRYQEDQIYTYTGKILLALNPFQPLHQLYGDHVMEKYWQKDELAGIERPPPHIYAIAQDAYQCMSNHGENQSILVSGESGSGKTVTTKIIMGYLATLSQKIATEATQSSPSAANTNANADAHSGVEAQILQSNPILESFGNARTVRNDNSSRFGKFMELLFSANGSLVSASIETYLLEKVRLISPSYGERNYHVFYELLAGVTQRERQSLCIGNKTLRDFRMTACSGTFDRRDGISDRETYNDLREALDTVGFAHEEQQSMFAVASALLHASNLTFDRSSEAGEDSSQLVQSNPSLRSVVQLLGVPAEALNNALCLCEIKARGESFYKNLSVEQATKAVEAFIKATYGALFTYIVQRINDSIALGSNSSSGSGSRSSHGAGAMLDINPPMHSFDGAAPSTRIGVLDIFGFESFAFNSFEQLCINYCNEALQQQFNRFVFKLEQDEYQREGIEWSFITFPDNQEMLDLIEKKRDGILSILDEHCRIPRGSDKSFAQAMYEKCQDHPRFSATNTQKGQMNFAIHHYAGVVVYDAIDFLEKNKDELPKETTDLLISSSVPFLAGLGDILEHGPMPLTGSSSLEHGDSQSSGLYMSNERNSQLSPGSNHNNKSLSRGSSSLIRESLGAQFSRQLKDLRRRIDCTTPHYVRCLKPNDDLVPRRFEAHIVADQLRCAGVLEAIRVSRVGFPHRYLHEAFLQRYEVLVLPKEENNRGYYDAGDRCCDLIDVLSEQIAALLIDVSGGTVDADQEQEQGLAEREIEEARNERIDELMLQGVQIGNTKVFLQKQLYDALEFLRAKKLTRSAILIQTHVRRFQAECYRWNVTLAAIIVQTYARRFFAMKRARSIRQAQAAIRIQTAWRMHQAVQYFYAAYCISMFAQRYWRGRISRQLYRMIAVDYMALRIQRVWRRAIHRFPYVKLRRSAIILQSLWRRKEGINAMRSLRREARNLDSVAAERDRFRQEVLNLRRELEEVKHINGSNGSNGVGSGGGSPQGYGVDNGEVDRLKREVEKLQCVLAQKQTTLRTEKLENGRLQGKLAEKDSALHHVKASLGMNLSNDNGQDYRKDYVKMYGDANVNGNGHVNVNANGNRIANMSNVVNTSLNTMPAMNESASTASSGHHKKNGWLGRMFGRKDTDSQVSLASFSPLPVLQRAWSTPSKQSMMSANQGSFDSPMTEQQVTALYASATGGATVSGSPSVANSNISVSLLDTEDPADARPLQSVSESHGAMYSGAGGDHSRYSNNDWHVTRNLNDTFGSQDPDRAYRGDDPSQKLNGALAELHHAVLSSDVAKVNKLCENSSDMHDLTNQAGRRGRTALHLSVTVDNVPIARTLMKSGAIANAQDGEGQTPLHLATSAPMTKLLLDTGRANANIPDIDGVCALHRAVERRDIGSVRLLLDSGARVNAADNVRWLNALHTVALPAKLTAGKEYDEQVLMRARPQIANLLCSASGPSATEYLNEQDREGNAPIHHAAQIDTADASDLMNVFLEKGATPNVMNGRKQPPMLLLCHNDSLRAFDSFHECLHDMLFHDADPNLQSATGCTPLHLSLYHRDIDGAVQLVNRAAELHLIWTKPKRWTAFWDDMGTAEVLPLDMVKDEHSLHRILAAISHPPKWAPSRPWCMNCRTGLGTFARAIFCRHCGRNVCGACARTTLGPEYFPKSFEIYEASWVCVICEKILMSRKEETSSSTHPISSIGDGDF